MSEISGDAIAKSFNPPALFDKLSSMNDSTAIFALSVLNIVILLMAIMVYMYYTGSIFSKGLRERDCKLMTEIYGELNGKISTIIDAKTLDLTLREFYVKTAYNACSGGNYKNDYVDTCVLTSLLKQGVRGLDFEIFSIGDNPVVATTTSDSNCVKETFNYVLFSEVLNIITTSAFTSSNAPNAGDPLILHLRIKSTNQSMFNKLTNLLDGFNNTNGRLLGTNYSYNTKNLSDVPLSELMGKVVIIVDGTNTSFLDLKFNEYVNMLSSTAQMRGLRYYDIKYTPDMNELIRHNMSYLTIGMPDKGSNPACPSSILMRAYGVQLLALRYQSVDSNVEENNAFFDDSGHAFVLKPDNLRYKPIIIADATKQDDRVSYGTQRLYMSGIPGNISYKI
jgi:hypothetical protein